MWPHAFDEQTWLTPPEWARVLIAAEAARAAAQPVQLALGVPLPANDDRIWDPQIILCK